jgi:ATP-dependent DNA helicase RecQ
LEYVEDIYHKVHIFYDIPYDTGEGRQLKFNLEEFCSHFKLQRQSVHYAMVYIERTGHWTLSEDVDISTKIQIMADRNDLYEIDLPDPKMAVLLETMMRRYTGIFSYPVPIDEEYMASKIGEPVPQLRQLLYRLSLEHVVRYVPSDHATVLFLHHERLRPKNLNLDPDRYAFLKEASSRRTQKMIDYVSEESICCSSYLLGYFGQTDADDCGTCDICRLSAPKKEKDLSSGLISFINEDMSGKYSSDDVIRHFCGPSGMTTEDVSAVLRCLIDEGKVPAPGL